jgi:branched-chain amino acid transport system permease protein
MVNMELIVGTIANILISSSMFILVALGLAFIFNMMGILNLAHGAIYMIGGYVTYAFAVGLGMNTWVALFISTAIFSLFGVFLEKYCFRPFVGNFDASVVLCVGVTIILQNIVNNMLGTQIMAIPRFMGGVFKAGLVSVSYMRLITFAIGGILTGTVILFVKGTRLGQQMQAITQNREAAYLQGIDVNRVQSLACAIGCGLAAVAGSLMGAYTNLNPFMGDDMLATVLMLVILAGAGSIGGIVMVGFILGCLNAVLPVVLTGDYAQAIYVAIVVVILLFRPQGFFGHEV